MESSRICAQLQKTSKRFLLHYKSQKLIKISDASTFRHIMSEMQNDKQIQLAVASNRQAPKGNVPDISTGLETLH